MSQDLVDLNSTRCNVSVKRQVLLNLCYRAHKKNTEGVLAIELTCSQQQLFVFVFVLDPLLPQLLGRGAVESLSLWRRDICSC